jgi:hypothetical protein
MLRHAIAERFDAASTHAAGSREPRRQFDDTVDRLVYVRLDRLWIRPVIGDCLIDIGHRLARVSARFGKQRYVHAAELVGKVALVLGAHRNDRVRLPHYFGRQRAALVLPHVEASRKQITRHNWTYDVRKIFCTG